MTFENEIWLYLTPLLLLVAAAMLFFGSRQRDVLLAKFAATRLIEQLTAKASPKRLFIKSLCVLLAIAGIGFALAQPQYGLEWSERKARGLDLVFAVDSSKSMLATDLRPNRLARAKLAVMDLIGQLESDRIGLVAFAGRAFLQTPPTLDYAAFRESLEALGPSTMSRGGSDIGSALREAEKAFPKDNNFKAILLLTDGEDLGGDAIDAAKELAAKQIKVYTIGIGTPSGEILRIRNRFGSETTVRDDAGNPVLTKLDEDALVQISQITGGSYSRLSAQSLDTLYNSALATLPRAERETELQERRIERFQWLLAPAVILLMLEMLIRRRGRSAIQAALLFAALGAVLPQPAEAQEAPPSETSAEPITDARIFYNQAYEALQAGEFATAQGLYENAIRSSDDLQLQADALYNLAHADYQIARQTYESGDLQAALEQMQSAEGRFQSALEIDPNDSAANADLAQVTDARKMIEQLIQQQKEQEQQQQDQQDQQQDQQDQENQESQSSEESQDGQQSEESQSEENSDSESSENESSESSEGEDQPSEAEGSEDQNSESEGEEEPGQEVPMTEDSPSEDESESQAGTPAGEATEALEGMSEAEAQALLDSLRGEERLLPLATPSRSQNSNDLRDW